MRQKSSVCPETLPRHSNIIPARPLRNLPEIFFLPSFLKLFLIRAQRQNIYFFFFIVCLFVCAVDHEVTEGEPVDEQYCSRCPRTSTASPNPKDSTSIRTSRKALWTVQSHPLMHILSQFYTLVLFLIYPMHELCLYPLRGCSWTWWVRLYSPLA